MKRGIVFSIIFLLIAGILTTVFIQSRIEFGKSYNFEITKIERQTNGYLILYSNKEKYFFANFSFTSSDSIEVGDKIVKKADAKIMYVFRRDNNGKFKIFLIKKPNGNFK